MEKLKKALQNLPPEKLDQLKGHLELGKKGTESSMLSKVISLWGLDLLISSLSEKELELLKHAAASPEGLRYSDLEKLTHLKTEAIEEIAESLKNKLLIYILKNRKHLNNKLDKIQLFDPVAERLKASSWTEISKELSANTKAPEKKESKKIDDTLSLSKYIFSNGGIVTLKELYSAFSAKKSFETELEKLINAKLVKVHHILDYPFNTVVVLTPESYLYAKKSFQESKGASVKNGFISVNNLLTVYDKISTYGLYLTQQNDFRKVDLHRITEALTPPMDKDGVRITKAECAEFSLFLLAVTKDIWLKKDFVYASLRSIRENIYDPIKIARKITSSIANKNEIEPIFKSPFSIPGEESIRTLYTLAENNSPASEETLRTLFMIHQMSEKKESVARFKEFKSHTFSSFDDSLRFLILLGILFLKDGKIVSVKSEKEGESKTIYINADFTLMIPKDDLTSDLIYQILSYTDVVKDDIALQTKITKESILRSFKRKMDIEHFIQILEKNSKNGIPQNLRFLLNDWIKQTLNIEIASVTLLKANHPSFFEDIAIAIKGECIIERISEKYAIVDRKYLDEIVHLAEKQKAIISISEDDGE